MRIDKKFFISLLVVFAISRPFFVFAENVKGGLFAPGERTEWMGTYFKGKKLGFSYAKMITTSESIAVDSKVFFRLKAGSVDQSTTFFQETNLTLDLQLKDFSLVQEIMGHRQQVDGHMEDGNLVYRVRGTGFDKTKSIPFSLSTAPSSTFLLNIVKSGLKVGKKGKMPLFMEPFQMKVPLEYKILRKEMFQYQGQPVETFVILHRVAGMESTLWVTPDGSVMRESTSQGFESLKEPEHIAQNLGDETMSVSNLITLSIIKPNKEISRPGEVHRLKMRVSEIRSPDLIPQDHRQKVVRSKKTSKDSFSSILLVNAEPVSVSQPAIRPVRSFSRPELLEETAEVQSNHPMIRALAMDLVGETKDAWTAAKTINKWVFDNLDKALVDSVSALNALKERRGECQSHTYLFTALARSAGIPTKIVNGLVYSSKYEGFLYHAWPEVYVGEWRALDPTFGQDTVDATHIKLSEGQKDNPIKLMEFIGKVRIELVEAPGAVN